MPSEIDDDEFWRELRRRVKRANPEAYLVGEIWYDARRWLAGDQFDATMNYPLAKAALGFFVKDLDLDAVRSVGGYRDVRPLGAGDFAAEVERVLGLYDPAVRDAQLNLLGSHDTPRFLTASGNDLAALEMAFLFLFTAPGRPVRLLRRRDRPRRRPRSRLPACLPLGRVVLGPRPARSRQAARGPAPRPPGAPAGFFPDADGRGRGRRLRARRRRSDAVVAVFNVSREERRVDLAVGSVGPLLVDAATGEELAVTDGELRDVVLPPRSGRALAVPPRGRLKLRAGRVKPLYHLLDPLWRRFPFPAGHTFEATAFEDATVLRMARTYRGREILPVYCYAVGDTLVDTGISSVADEVVAAARKAKVERVVLTHHHEDHSGNAARLASLGAEVLATGPGVRLVAHDLPRRFYQHVLWGEADPVEAHESPLGGPARPVRRPRRPRLGALRRPARPPRPRAGLAPLGRRLRRREGEGLPRRRGLLRELRDARALPHARLRRPPLRPPPPLHRRQGGDPRQARLAPRAGRAREGVARRRDARFGGSSASSASSPRRPSTRSRSAT